MTLTLEALARSRLVVFTVSGPSKRDAVAAVSSGADVPASRVRAGQVLWIVDRDAAGPDGVWEGDG
jgi:6-phosphogluconolactonase